MSICYEILEWLWGWWEVDAPKLIKALVAAFTITAWLIVVALLSSLVDEACGILFFIATFAFALALTVID